MMGWDDIAVLVIILFAAFFAYGIQVRRAFRYSEKHDG